MDIYQRFGGKLNMEALSWLEAFLFCYCSLWQSRVACIRQDDLSYWH